VKAAVRSARVRSLSFHASYRCGNSGVCCSSGWDIPVEPGVARRLQRELRAGRASFRGAGAADRERVLARTASGRCVFLEGRRGATRCAAQRRLGADALPSACRQFPRVVTLTPAGVSVTLSHYCPTAARLLFADAEEPVRIVESAPAFPASWRYEGLDARDALPPLLRPGSLMTWAALERWEQHAVAALTDRRGSPEQAVRRLAADAEAARRWTPDDGDFDDFFERVLAGATPLRRSALDTAAPPDPLPATDLSCWDLVLATVPDDHPRPRRPSAAVDAEPRALVGAGWPQLAAPIGRWLAAKAFGSWLALQGDGLRTTAAGLRLALAVLRAEAAAACAAARAPLDAAILGEAIRRADLLLVQLADPRRLARRLGRSERGRVLASKHRG
jgi:Fe-S-cluster containining protein